MKRTPPALVFILSFSCLFVSPSFVLSAEDFSQERALEHLKVLAGSIGPRPLGSPQEKAALTYFAEKIAEFGCQVEWQPVSGGKAILGGGTLNTASFNIIGRLPGQTEREIVIGAHIDSSTPEIPGANDDGSGVATMLEVARVLSREAHQSTLVFVAFCGEEAGLVGSKSFVEHYPLQNIALMLQLDMTSDDSPLMLWIDRKKEQSPKWLVSASIEALHRLGYRNVDYPTIFQSLNGSLGGAGSDHEPFMEKGIPAIGFVSDVRFPIHTRHDSLEYFRPDGLARSGKLILELLSKFDGGVPDKKLGRYMLVLMGQRPLFIPVSLLAILTALSLLVGLLALLFLFKKRKTGISWEDDKKIRKSWPKLLVLELLMLIV
ncbi:MAG: M28 family metallopeptidase, partial [Acidobacteriota bacterium]